MRLITQKFIYWQGSNARLLGSIIWFKIQLCYSLCDIKLISWRNTFYNKRIVLPGLVTVDHSNNNAIPRLVGRFYLRKSHTTPPFQNKIQPKPILSRLTLDWCLVLHPTKKIIIIKNIYLFASNIKSIMHTHFT